MKTAIWALLGVVLLSGTAHARQSTYDDRHRISVTGESLVNVAPDRAIVTFGVDTRDMVLDTAKRQNDAIVKKALAAINAMAFPTGTSRRIRSPSNSASRTRADGRCSRASRCETCSW